MGAGKNLKEERLAQMNLLLNFQKVNLHFFPLKLILIECKNHGAEVSGIKFLSLIVQVRARPEWVSAIKKLRAHGFATATITNNFHTSSDPETNKHDQESMVKPGLPITHLLFLARRQFFMTLFDVVVESSVEGIRKPDPKIYQLAVQQLGVKYWECIYFDDLGQNLKPAQEMVSQLHFCFLLIELREFIPSKLMFSIIWMLSANLMSYYPMLMS